MKSFPPVTVIIPAYNAGKTLKRTIDSVLLQDYKNIEIVVCDNSSTDNTASIVRSYKDKNVRLVVNPVVKTAEDNWIFALKNIEADYLALYHADDVYTPGMISGQMQVMLNKPAVGAVFTMALFIDENDRVLQSKYLTFDRLPQELNDKTEFDFSLLFNSILKYDNFIKTPTLLTRKSVLNKVGSFNTIFKSSADLDLWLRICRHFPVSIINEPLHKYRISPTQGSATIFANRRELPDYFAVITHYLKDPEVQNLLTKESSRAYEMKKGAAAILCAMNLLTDNQTGKAREMLKQALALKNLGRAAANKKDLITYLAGYLLRISMYFGMGRRAAKLTKKGYQYFKKSSFNLSSN